MVGVVGSSPIAPTKVFTVVPFQGETGETVKSGVLGKPRGLVAAG